VSVIGTAMTVFMVVMVVLGSIMECGSVMPAGVAVVTQNVPTGCIDVFIVVVWFGSVVVLLMMFSIMLGIIFGAKWMTQTPLVSLISLSKLINDIGIRVPMRCRVVMIVMCRMMNRVLMRQLAHSDQGGMMDG